jgi:Fe-S cluster assembly iron-binding protein IscA
MFEVSETAREMVKEFFKENEQSPIRIIAGSGCCSPSLGMALDKPQEDDEVFDDDGITYVINKELFERAKPICVDFVNTEMGSGFTISSSITQDSSCPSSCHC